MSSMLDTIVPKSDQQNFDDYIGGRTRTIKITGVKVANGDQPVALSFEGDDGKPWKPCKSMRRVLVNVWGPDANAYTGRCLTLYGDPKVRFGGMEVGGIRISHMSGITEPVTMALTSTRAKRTPYTVQPLAIGGIIPPKQPSSDFDALVKEAYGATTLEGVESIAKKASKLAKVATPEQIAELREVLSTKREEFKPTDRQPGDE